MNNLLETAREKMSASYDRAEGHRKFVTMFSAAGMSKESAWHEKQAESESHMGDVWAGFYAELSAGVESMQIQINKTPPITLRDIVDAIAAARGVTLYK